MGEAEAPDRAEIEQALERVREAAVGFDELFTSMTIVQRHLLGLTRGLDAAAVSRLEPGEATDLLGKLQELVIVLEDLQRFRTPARNITSSVRRPPPPARTSEEWLDEQRQLLAERPLRRETVVRVFRKGFQRDHFPMLAELIEQLDRENALESALPELKVADVIASMSNLGPRRAAVVLGHAELPPDVRFEDLGPADVQRIGRTLRVTAHGIPRDETGGVPGADPAAWPGQPGPSEFTPEDKTRYDTEQAEKDQAELAAGGGLMVEVFLDTLEAQMWEALGAEQPAELLTQLRAGLPDQVAGLDAAVIVTGMYRWMIEQLMPAVRVELDLPLLRTDADYTATVRVAGNAANHVISEWNGKDNDPEAQRLFWRYSMLQAVGEIAKQMKAADQLRPNFPRRRQSSPLRAYERAAGEVAHVATCAYVLAAETTAPLITQLPEELRAAAERPAA